MLRCLAVVAGLAGPAWADAVDPHRIAIAVNSPISWGIGGGGFGISGWAGLTEHQAIRANVASYGAGYYPVAMLAAVSSGAPPDEDCSATGTISDVGASWVYFPRKVYSGLSLEVGALRRSTTKAVLGCDLAASFDTTRHSVTYAGRAMIGWSWMLGDHAFIAIAVGAAKGVERGHVDQRQSDDSPLETVRVDQWTPTFESYLRFGAAI